MLKLIKCDNKVTALLSNGNVLTKEVTEKEWQILSKTEDENTVLEIMSSKYKEKITNFKETKKLVNKINESKYLKFKKEAAYWPSISPLSLPKDLIDKILKAERNKDEIKLTAYKNFWTLMSLNTDEECRNNLFWFLTTHGFKIAKCGFFVAYRNVDSTAEEGVYTDHHTHTTRIQIGEMVTLDRSECDCDSNVECSRGLHAASATWLKRNYFGNIGLAILVNPADVVAVPHNSEYGKLRTCAYLPMSIINYDKNDNLIPLDVEDGFDCSYVTKVIYEGIMGTEEDSPYKIKIPELPNIQKESIQDTLLEIAKACIVNKQL